LGRLARRERQCGPSTGRRREEVAWERNGDEENRGEAVDTGTEAAPAKEKGARNIDLAQVRQQITNIIGSEAEEMVWAGIEEGKKGHYQAMKFLFEAAGIFPKRKRRSEVIR